MTETDYGRRRRRRRHRPAPRRERSKTLKILDHSHSPRKPQHPGDSSRFLAPRRFDALWGVYFIDTNEALERKTGIRLKTPVECGWKGRDEYIYWARNKDEMSHSLPTLFRSICRIAREIILDTVYSGPKWRGEVFSLFLSLPLSLPPFLSLSLSPHCRVLWHRPFASGEQSPRKFLVDNDILDLTSRVWSSFYRLLPSVFFSLWSYLGVASWVDAEILPPISAPVTAHSTTRSPIIAKKIYRRMSLILPTWRLRSRTHARGGKYLDSSNS